MDPSSSAEAIARDLTVALIAKTANSIPNETNGATIGACYAAILVAVRKAFQASY